MRAFYEYFKSSLQRLIEICSVGSMLDWDFIMSRTFEWLQTAIIYTFRFNKQNWYRVFGMEQFERIDNNLQMNSQND